MNKKYIDLAKKFYDAIFPKEEYEAMMEEAQKIIDKYKEVK